MVNLKEILDIADKKGFAVGAFNVYDAESVTAVIEAAEEEKSPVIMITGPLEIPLLGLEKFLEVVRILTQETRVPVCLHLDHYQDPDFVKKAIRKGFPSVMIDGSRLPFEDNIRITRDVVKSAREYGVSVEGELGRIGRAELSREEGETIETTDPDRAREFVERTGVDTLAVNIGNAHGIYPSLPRLNLKKLEEIKEKVDVPLVLHGGSSTPPEIIREVISRGIRKVNIATELHLAFSEVMWKDLNKGKGFTWASTSLLEVKKRQKEIVKKWMRILGSSGRI